MVTYEVSIFFFTDLKLGPPGQKSQGLQCLTELTEGSKHWDLTPQQFLAPTTMWTMIPYRRIWEHRSGVWLFIYSHKMLETIWLTKLDFRDTGYVAEDLTLSQEKSLFCPRPIESNL